MPDYNTLASTFEVLVPILFVLALGYGAGRAKRFTLEEVGGINRVVVDFALPAALLVGTARTPRAELLQQGPLILALFIAYVGLWLSGLALGLRVFHHDLATAALQGAAVAFPNVGFAGVPILAGLFGPDSILSVAIGTVMGMLTFIPLTVSTVELARHMHRAGQDADVMGAIVPAFAAALKTPLVIAPIVGATLVLLGVPLPPLAETMFNLIGATTSGIAIFAAGLILAAYSLRVSPEVVVNTFFKMGLHPAAMFLLVTALRVERGMALEGIIMCALPTAVLSTILAARYGSYQSEASSTMVLTTALMVVTLPLVMLLLA